VAMSRRKMFSRAAQGGRRSGIDASRLDESPRDDHEDSRKIRAAPLVNWRRCFLNVFDTSSGHQWKSCDYNAETGG